MRSHPSLAVIILVAICLCLSGCGRLPRDFETLPLDRKIDAYSNRFKWGGRRSLKADKLIAGHGYQAAEAMVPYIKQQKRGIPVYHATSIVWDVQVRGCDLRGSTAEEALRDALKDPDILDYEKRLVATVLAFIAENRHSPSGGPVIPPHLCAPVVRPRRPSGNR